MSSALPRWKPWKFPSFDSLGADVVFLLKRKEKEKRCRQGMKRMGNFHLWFSRGRKEILFFSLAISLSFQHYFLPFQVKWRRKSWYKDMASGEEKKWRWKKRFAPWVVRRTSSKSCFSFWAPLNFFPRTSPLSTWPPGLTIILDLPEARRLCWEGKEM